MSTARPFKSNRIKRRVRYAEAEAKLERFLKDLEHTRDYGVAWTREKAPPGAPPGANGFPVYTFCKDNANAVRQLLKRLKYICPPPAAAGGDVLRPS